MKKTILMITLSFLAISCSDNANNSVVTDSATGLIWQDSYKDNGGKIKRASWENALSYCDNLRLDNKDDWRLPTLKELETIIKNPKYNSTSNSVFKYFDTGFYWSSTLDSTDSRYAFDGSFGYGVEGISWSFEQKRHKNKVRCVRN